MKTTTLLMRLSATAAVAALFAATPVPVKIDLSGAVSFTGGMAMAQALPGGPSGDPNDPSDPFNPPGGGGGPTDGSTPPGDNGSTPPGDNGTPPGDNGTPPGGGTGGTGGDTGGTGGNTGGGSGGDGGNTGGGGATPPNTTPPAGSTPQDSSSDRGDSDQKKSEPAASNELVDQRKALAESVQCPAGCKRTVNPKNGDVTISFAVETVAGPVQYTVQFFGTSMVIAIELTDEQVRLMKASERPIVLHGKTTIENRKLNDSIKDGAIRYTVTEEQHLNEVASGKRNGSLAMTFEERFRRLASDNDPSLVRSVDRAMRRGIDVIEGSGS